MKSAAFKLMLLCLLIVGLAACGGDEEGAPAEAAATEEAAATQAEPGSLGELIIGNDSYPDTEAIDAAAIILLKQIGYEVEPKPLQVAVLYASLARGDIDIYSGGYLPIGHSDYWDEFGDKLEKLGPLHFGAHHGIGVPAYLTEVNSIPDLAKFRDKFDEKIIGNDPGTGNMRKTAEAIKAYGLNFELVASSDAAEGAAIKRAVGNKEWIAFSAYEPHWWFGKFDLKFLEDPKNIYPKNDGVYHVVRKGLKEDKPEAYRFYQNYKMTPKQQAEIMVKIEEGMSRDEAGQWFIDQNPDLVEQWLAGVTG